MQEELTQRAALIGGASVRCRGTGPASPAAAAWARCRASGSRSWATPSRGWSNSRWISRPGWSAFPGSTRWTSTRPASGSGRAVAGHHPDPRPRRAGQLRAVEPGLRFQRRPGSGAAPRGASGSPWATMSCGSHSRPRAPGTGPSTSCARRWCLTHVARRFGSATWPPRRARGASRISREDQQYVRILSYDFRGPVKLANRTHEAFMRSISVPAGYTVSDEYFGWEDDQSQKGLWLVFGVGLALVALDGGDGVRLRLGRGDGLSESPHCARRRGRGLLGHPHGVHPRSSGRGDPGDRARGESVRFCWWTASSPGRVAALGPSWRPVAIGWA